MSDPNDTIQRVVNSAFKNMEASSNFRNLNVREQQALRQMIVHTVMASQIIAQGAVRGTNQAASPEIMDELKGIREILQGMAKQGYGLIRSGQAPSDSAPVTVEEVEKLTEHFLNQKGLKTNLDAVKVESGESQGVGSAVDRLKKLQGN